MTKMTMPEIHAAMNEKATAYNSALIAEKFDKLPDITKSMDELQAEYAKQAKEEFLENVKQTETLPLTLALMMPDYKVIVYRDKADKEAGTVTRVIEEKTRVIQLGDLYGVVPKAFKSNNWKAYVEQFNLRMLLWTATELGRPASEIKEIAAKFSMSEGGRSVDIGATPTSNNQLLKQLRQVIGLIYGEGEITNKITSHDVAYLKMAYTKMGRELRHISTLNNSKMAAALLVVMNQILTEQGYAVDYKEQKEKANADSVSESKPEAKKPAKKAAKQPAKKTTKKAEEPATAETAA